MKTALSFTVVKRCWFSRETALYEKIIIIIIIILTFEQFFFYVSLSLVTVPTVLILINFVTQPLLYVISSVNSGGNFVSKKLFGKPEINNIHPAL